MFLAATAAATVQQDSEDRPAALSAEPAGTRRARPYMAAMLCLWRWRGYALVSGIARGDCTVGQHTTVREFWWNELSLDTGQTARWDIGPLVLQVCRLEQEWQVAYARADISADDAHDWQFVVVNERLGAEADLKRYLFKTA